MNDDVCRRECSLRKTEIANKQVVKSEWRETSELFVCIGGKPNAEWAKDTPIARDRAGIRLRGQTFSTKADRLNSGSWKRMPYYLEIRPGSFAAGDVRRRAVNRVASAAGEGATALTFVDRYLTETD
jgi:thioredoxin reductase (NADPH)